MPREKLSAKFVGPRDADGVPLEFVNGVPAKDHSESEFANLSDEQKAAMDASPLYDLRHDAPAEAEKAATRVAPAADAAPLSTGTVTVPAAPDAPKAEAKK